MLSVLPIEALSFSSILSLYLSIYLFANTGNLFPFVLAPFIPFSFSLSLRRLSWLQIDLTVEVCKLLSALQHERSEIAHYIFTKGNRLVSYKHVPFFFSLNCLFTNSA